MRRRDSASTRCSAARLEWNVTPRAATAGCRPSSAGSSVSMVTLELGTMSPTRCGAVIVAPLQIRERGQRLLEQRGGEPARLGDPDPFRHVAVLGAGLLDAALTTDHPAPDDVLQRLDE